MNVFWIVAALFVAGALLMLLPPLWAGRGSRPASAAGLNLAIYRDQMAEAERDVEQGVMASDQLRAVRAEIERRLLEDVAVAAPPVPSANAARRSAYALALLIPLGSIATYLALGDLQALSMAVEPAAPVAAAPGGRHSVTPEQIQRMVASLAERLKAEPADVEGWAMLGRSYTALGRYRDAATALERATQLAPGNATLLADLADVQGMVQGKRLAGAPARLVQQALDADPRHVKALALAGSVAFEARDYAAAVGYWERAVAELPPGSEIARSMQGSIEQARRADAAPPAPQVSPPAQPAQTAQGAAQAGARAIVGEVTLAPELAARVTAGDTLFVFARAVEGPRVPLAVWRRPVGAWPARFVLDDSLAMAPGMRLSGYDRVKLGARISRTGNAAPQPGDLVGEAGVTATGSQGVRIRIDGVQP